MKKILPQEATIDQLLSDILPKNLSLKIGRSKDSFIISSDQYYFIGTGNSIKDALINFQVKIFLSDSCSNFGFWTSAIDWFNYIKREIKKQDDI